MHLVKKSTIYLMLFLFIYIGVCYCSTIWITKTSSKCNSESTSLVKSITGCMVICETTTSCNEISFNYKTKQCQLCDDENTEYENEDDWTTMKYLSQSKENEENDQCKSLATIKSTTPSASSMKYSSHTSENDDRETSSVASTTPAIPQNENFVKGLLLTGKTDEYRPIENSNSFYEFTVCFWMMSHEEVFRFLFGAGTPRDESSCDMLTLRVNGKAQITVEYLDKECEPKLKIEPLILQHICVASHVNENKISVFVNSTFHGNVSVTNFNTIRPTKIFVGAEMDGFKCTIDEERLFQGILADFNMWNITLNQGEINSLYKGNMVKEPIIKWEMFLDNADKNQIKYLKIR